jgi:hypothetical protein
VRKSLAAVTAPGRGHDLVRAAGAARLVERTVVAPRLAHHDVGGDRPFARPGAELLAGAPGLGHEVVDLASQLVEVRGLRRLDAPDLGAAAFELGLRPGDLVLGRGELDVVVVDLLLDGGDPSNLFLDLVVEPADALGDA